MSAANENWDALLPWFAAGLLTDAEASGVRAALRRDAGLRRALAAVNRERDAVTAIADEQSGPSPRTRTALFAAIEADARARKKSCGH